MYVRKAIPSFCKFYSSYEEKPEDFLNETDVEIFFTAKILYLFQSQHRLVNVSKGSEKILFHSIYCSFDI